MSFKSDPIQYSSTFARSAGMNVNHATIPVVRKILTMTLAEFDPKWWEEVSKSPSARAAALATYEKLKSRLSPSF